MEFVNLIQGMIVIHLNKVLEVLINKPVYLGFAVLEWSKLLVYET